MTPFLLFPSLPFPPSFASRLRFPVSPSFSVVSFAFLTLSYPFLFLPPCLTPFLPPSLLIFPPSSTLSISSAVPHPSIFPVLLSAPFGPSPHPSYFTRCINKHRPCPFGSDTGRIKRINASALSNGAITTDERAYELIMSDVYTPTRLFNSPYSRFYSFGRSLRVSVFTFSLFLPFFQTRTEFLVQLVV